MARRAIAVLMTVHNRRAQTLACLAALDRQRLDPETSVDVHLVDDGSTDGTAQAVRERHPSVRVLRGTGSLYWGGGMRMAFDSAARSDYQFHAWLNDDAVLDPDALAVLLTTYRRLERADGAPVIVVGSMRHPSRPEQTYGGFRFRGPRVLMRFGLVAPSDEPQRCDTLTGNCALIPREIFRQLGNLSDRFTHVLGDVDYGLRAGREGFAVWVAPGYVGTCPDNHEWRNDLYELDSLGAVFRRLSHPKGLNYGSHFQERFLPAREWTVFLRRHAPIGWPLPWALTYRKLPTLLLGRWAYRARMRLTPWLLGRRREPGATGARLARRGPRDAATRDDR